MYTRKATLRTYLLSKISVSLGHTVTFLFTVTSPKIRLHITDNTNILDLALEICFVDVRVVNGHFDDFFDDR